MVKVVISGIMGRMGRTIARLAYEDPEVQIAGGVESPDCVHFHENVKDILNKEDVDAPITADLSKIIERADVIIDFAGSTEAVLGHVRLAAADQNRKCMVIGTTGFSDEELEEIRQLSKDIPIVLAPNMSIGVNLLSSLWRMLQRL